MMMSANPQSPIPNPVFAWPVRVYYEDTDATGVVYHANYLRWLERARTEWLRRHGLHQQTLLRDHGVVFTLASLEIAYLRPARLDDQLEIVTEISERKRASFRFAQSVRRKSLAPPGSISSGQQDVGETLATASVRAACVDAVSFKPRPLPDFLKAPAHNPSPASPALAVEFVKK